MTIKLIPIPASYLRRNTCVKASAILAIQIATTIVCSGFLFGDDSKQSDEYFERRVRPILAERCFECHSSDSEKIHGGLRVDHVSLMLKGGDSGPAIVSGDAGESLLVKAIKYDGYEMPPNSRLPDAEVEVLRDWIAGGAHWPKEAVPERKAAKPPFDLKKRMDEHWVWRPIVAPKTPKQIANLASNNPVDRFIDAALAEANITPNGSIDRAVLIRRLYFDLIGLPPTLDELNEWLECKDENWTEQLVDRLLANPQFGVRWGRHWLDLVRFANSRGHEFDEDIPVADEYRDYVVRALNSDLPYDEFVREHIAGDLIQPPRTSNDGRINESVIATGYWHLGEWVHSPVDSRKDETDRFDNMIDVFSKTFLGLTVACARCHDHKFDAISTEDYYALYGFLKSSDYRLIRYETDIEHRKVANQLEAIRVRSNQELRNTIWAAIEAESKPPVSVGKELQPSERSVTASLKSALAETRSKLADKPLATPLPIEDNRVKFDVRNTDLRLWNSDGVVFGNRPNRAGELLLSRSGDPNEFRVAIQDEGARDSFWNRITNSHRVVNQQNKFAQLNEAGKLLPTPAFELTADQISYLVRGSVRAFVSVDSLRMIAGPLHGETVLDSSGSADEYRWVTQSLSRYRDRTIHIEFAPMDDKPCGIVQVVLGSPPLSNRLISNDSDTDEEIIWKDFDALIHQDASSDISRSQNAVLIHAFSEWFRVRRQTLGDSHPLNVAIDQISERWRAEEDALSEKVEWNSRLALSMRDGTGQDDRVLIRGNPARPGDRAPRRSLTALGGCEAPMTGPGSGRQEWAKHITAPESPLLARVMANRVWHHLLGRGIVPTTDDFGALGQRPTHPELLDHLAIYLREHEWSIKSLIRTVCLSAAYQRDSNASVLAIERDPDNRLLSHARVRRLEAEAVRDSLLSIAGQLDIRLGGENVPVHLNEFLDGRGRPAKSGPMDGAGRRSMYLEIRRNFAMPMLAAFDMPTPFSSMGRRNVSNVPAQSLILLNDPLVHRLSEQWVAHELAFSSGKGEHIDRMIKTALGRSPTASEQQIMIEFVSDPAFESETDAWRSLAHMILNHNELIYRH